MGRNKKFLLSSLLVFVFTVCVGYVIVVQELSKSSVKGVSITISPSPTVSPSPKLFPTPFPTGIPLSTKIRPTSIKQYGGWYWQAGLNKSQVWIGTDSAGRDIWIDHFPAPTPTPTQKPAQQSSTQKTVSNASGTSSMRNMIQTVQTKIIEKK